MLPLTPQSHATATTPVRHSGFDIRHFPKSGWSDSNRRSRASKARGLAATLHPLIGWRLEAFDWRVAMDRSLHPPASGLQPQASLVRTAGFEPAIPWPPAKCDTRLRYVLKNRPEAGDCRLEVAMVRFLSSSLRPTASSLTRKRPAGVEPALPPWQSGRLPLHHGRLLAAELSKNRLEAVGKTGTGSFCAKHPKGRQAKGACPPFSVLRLESRDGQLVCPPVSGLQSPASPSSSYGSRTRLSALKGRYPQTDRRTSHGRAESARSESGWNRTNISGFSDRR